MVDIAAVVKAFPGVRPVAGLDGCWTWSVGRFYFTLALTAEGDHAMQLNCRDVLDLNLVVAVLAFARARTEAVLAAAPFAVLEGFTSPSATPFDSVAAVIPAVHRYQEFDYPDLNDVTYAVFPAYRCEFSGLETEEQATYRFDYMLDAAHLQRPPSPWIRMRFDNPKTGTGSIGSDFVIASADLLMQELRNLEHADNAFIEFENFRNERRHVSWSGELQLSNEDETRTLEMPDLLAWAHRFIHAGTDRPTGSKEPIVRLEIDAEPAVNKPTARDVRDALLRLKPFGPRWAVLAIRFNYYIQTRVVEDERLIVEYREGGTGRHYKAGGRLSRDAVINAFLDYLAGGNRWRTAFEWRRVELP